MTDQDKKIIAQSIHTAIRELESVLDLYGSKLDYRNISDIYPMVVSLYDLMWRLTNAYA